MHIRRFYAFAVVLGLLMFASANAASAREIKYPNKTPFFTFELPEGWRSQVKGGDADALYCWVNDESGLNVQFYDIATEEFGNDYPKFAEAALKIGKVKDIKVIATDDKTLKNGQKVKFVRSTFTGQNGKTYISLMVCLPMGSDRTCAIHCFLPEDQLDSHQSQIEGLLASIKTLE